VQLAKVEALPKPNPDAMSEDGSGLLAAVEPEVPTRQYVVGLPVVVGIRDDGFVIVDVDLSELASRKTLADMGANFDYSDEQVDADVALLRTWVQQHSVAGEGYVR
jgi:adenylate kinase